MFIDNIWNAMGHILRLIYRFGYGIHALSMYTCTKRQMQRGDFSQLIHG